MTVTSLKKYKGSTYEAELDGARKIYLHADIIADFGICTGLELDRGELRKIIYASNYRRAFQYALHLLDYRDYSCAEMRKKLVKTYKNQELCDNVMDKLRDIGVINDKRYADRLARRLVETKRYGLYWAKREMALKGLDKFTIEDSLSLFEDCTEENLAYLLEKKYSRLLTDENDRKSIEKVKSSLVQYGYSFDDINRAVRNYFECADDLQQED